MSSYNALTSYNCNFNSVCQWLATGQWFSLRTPISTTNKTDRHDITEIFLKVALNTIKPTERPLNYLAFQSIWQWA